MTLQTTTFLDVAQALLADRLPAMDLRETSRPQERMCETVTYVVWQ